MRSSLGLVNLFEDPESIIREGGWLKSLTKLQLLTGGGYIPDDYGVAFVLEHKAVIVCAPMPWHTLYGWAYHAYWRWRVGAGHAGSALQRAFDAGVEMERQHLERCVADLKADYQASLAKHVAAAELRGRRAVLDSILDELGDLGDDIRGGKVH